MYWYKRIDSRSSPKELESTDPSAVLKVIYGEKIVSSTNGTSTTGNPSTKGKNESINNPFCFKYSAL
jgi:hypothetical protein